MSNLRKVNDNISKDWLDFRENTISTFANEEDKRHFICFEKISKRILKNVPVKNRQYVKKQFNFRMY